MGVLTLAAAAVGTTVLARTTQASNRLVDEIAPARAEAFRLQAALLDQETGVRGYLLTGDRALLAPYTRGLKAERQARSGLSALMRDNERLLGDLRSIGAAVHTWRSDFAGPAVAAGGAGRSTVSVERGKQDFDRIRVLLSAQNDHLEQAREDARAALEHVRAQRNQVFLAILATFLFSGVALAILLHFTVARPLTALRAAAHRVADGSFDHHIPEHGPADLQAVAQAVEAMRVRVVAALVTSRRNEATLTQQTADLDAQAGELRRSNAELEQFAYVASHDLQEPLRKVASFCQLLEKRYGDRLDERGTRYIAFAVDGAKRMQVLINDLLTFSRVGRIDDTEQTVALDEVLDRALRNVATAAEESGTRVDRPGTLPRVLGDPTLLTMLWQNLIGNAIKFRHPDRAPHVRVTAEHDRDDAVWNFAVTDNGIGIPPEFADKVFVIFQRLHARDAYEGTGIGLSLCKKIVEHSGGRIRIDAEHTDGARLLFSLPAIAEPATADEQAAAMEGTTV
ncbi:sensor histidine kinase [Streptomyces sp. H27-D2]|uniref:sensor histidine kinase n=1 Tax=Streptomyces sp. H27-D2 TaxID=3046304 RepID=UPI003FA6C3AA